MVHKPIFLIIYLLMASKYQAIDNFEVMFVNILSFQL